MTDLTPPAGFVRPGNASESRPSYDGRAGALAGLILWTTLLTWATLTIYRFWARTRLRRYLWSRVSFLGDRLEYTGTGGELFRGFLIAAVVVVLIFGSLSLVELMVENEFLAGILTLLHYGLLAAGAAAGRFLARRYRLTRTRWRALRGNLGEGLGGYLGLYAGWLIVAAFSAGLLTPFMRVALERHLLNATWVGNQRLRCDARGRRVIGVWLLIYFFSIVVVGLAALPATLLVNQATALAPQYALDPVGTGVAAVVVGMLLAAPIVMLLYGVYCVAEFRALCAGTSVGAVRFSSDLSPTAVMAPILVYGLPLLATAVATVVAGLSFAIDDLRSAAIPASAVAILLFLLWRIASVVAWTHSLAARVIPSISVSGAFDPGLLMQNAGPVPRRGEGLAEMFDVAG